MRLGKEEGRGGGGEMIYANEDNLLKLSKQVKATT